MATYAFGLWLDKKQAPSYWHEKRKYFKLFIAKADNEKEAKKQVAIEYPHTKYRLLFRI